MPRRDGERVVMYVRGSAAPPKVSNVWLSFGDAVVADGSRDNHDSSRSSGQQLMIRSGGISARRAWAIAVSAYESWAVVWASLSSANTQPAANARRASM